MTGEWNSQMKSLIPKAEKTLSPPPSIPPHIQTKCVKFSEKLTVHKLTKYSNKKMI
jgi:hypothetical protein